MTNDIVKTAQDRMKQSIESLQREFGSIRAGRANASLLDRITVEYYGGTNTVEPIGWDFCSGSARAFDHSI